MTSPERRYREIRPLAQGGMATLALAERDDGAVVVIKRVRPPFDHDPVYRGLFRDEGELCACLSCDCIVQLLDRGQDELGPYLVFEHVDGTDLGLVLDAHAAQERGLELQAFFAVALPLCDALASAHEATDADGASLDLVHRDVSPGNVLLSKDGDVKLADFGVALSRLKTEHTIAGEMKGKFAYMAPEQTRGEAVTARSDVFAAGVVLWECLCGRRLFDGPTDADVVHAVREKHPPPLTMLRPDAPPALAALLERMLAKDAEARPAALREVHAELAAEASALCLDRGLRSHVARLARAHPRPDVDEHPHVSDLRRRTQRVLQPAPAPPPERARLPRALALALVVMMAAAGTIALVLASAREPLTSSNLPLSSSDLPLTSPSERLTSSSEPLTSPSEPLLAPSERLTSPSERLTSSNAALTSLGESPSAPPPGSGSGSSATTTPAPAAAVEATHAPRKAALSIPPAKPGVLAREKQQAVAAKGFGTLVLDSDPWANVAVDGEPLGQHTPLIGLRLPAGRHKVTLENPVYAISRTIDVDIRPQAETRRFVDLMKR